MQCTMGAWRHMSIIKRAAEAAPIWHGKKQESLQTHTAAIGCVASRSPPPVVRDVMQVTASNGAAA